MIAAPEVKKSVKKEIVEVLSLVLYNDDVNSFDHVINSLMSICNMELMESISQIMARSVQDLHKLIETKCNPNNHIKTMVLMMGFTTGIIL